MTLLMGFGDSKVGTYIMSHSNKVKDTYSRS